MSTALKILIPLILLSVSITSAHPLKMSFSKVEIKWDGTVKVQSKIFKDDISSHLKQLYHLEKVDFSQLESNGIQALQIYLQNHFYLEYQGQKINLLINDVSSSSFDLAIVLNLSTLEKLDLSDQFGAKQELYLVNTLLCDANPKQKNDISFSNEHFLLDIKNQKMKLGFQ